MTYDGAYRYYYDCENRLTDINNAADEAIVSYKYDFKGRRVRRAENGGQTTVFCYDGDRIIADYNEAGTWKKRYYYGTGIDEIICMTKGVPVTWAYYYHYDGLGSVAAMSYYNGSLFEKYTYDVFGKPTIRTAAGVPRATSYFDNRYLFTGREYDPCVGLYYYRARYYHPTLGRFLQTDPMYYAYGLNLYSYVGNNPINKIDPLGLGSVSILSPPPLPIDPSGPPSTGTACCDPESIILLTGFDRYLVGREKALFPGEDNPYWGGFRHCLGACLLKRKFGPLGPAITCIYDKAAEHPGDPESESDMFAERIGEWLISGWGGTCEEGCLSIYPPGRKGKTLWPEYSWPGL